MIVSFVHLNSICTNDCKRNDLFYIYVYKCNKPAGRQDKIQDITK